MRKLNTLYGASIALAMSGLLFSAGAVMAADGRKLDTGKIEQITGMKGTYNERENVFKVSMPRADVEVSVDGWKMPRFMGLGSWAEFTAYRTADIVMGRRVLLM